jgi:hypothetical protein
VARKTGGEFFLQKLKYRLFGLRQPGDRLAEAGDPHFRARCLQEWQDDCILAGLVEPSKGSASGSVLSECRRQIVR